MAKNQTSMIVAGVGVIGMGLGTFLHIIAMATPAWHKESLLSETVAQWGPFSACYGDNCDSYDRVDDDDVKSVRTCTIFGVLAAIGAIIFTVVAAVMNGSSRANIAKIFSILVIVAAGVAFLCIFIGFITWGREVMGKLSTNVPGIKRDLGYSFALTVIGGLLIGGGGLIAGIGGMFGKKK